MAFSAQAAHGTAQPSLVLAQRQSPRPLGAFLGIPLALTNNRLGTHSRYFGHDVLSLAQTDSAVLTQIPLLKSAMSLTSGASRKATPSSGKPTRTSITRRSRPWRGRTTWPGL